MPRAKVYRTNAEKQASYRTRQRKKQPVHLWHKSDEWETPPDLFNSLKMEFPFSIDLSALPHNAKCEKFFSPAQDGLKQKWIGVCWMNPPYGPVIKDWMKKATESARAGATIVCLLPARTDTAWFHDFVLPYAEIRWIRGRLKFNGVKTGATFPSMLAIFRPPV